jgi:hypothetical protein
VSILRFRARRTEPSPPAFYEPTPYCDRLTLAEPFHADVETRATAEDRRAEPLRVIQATTSVIPSRARR